MGKSTPNAPLATSDSMGPTMTRQTRGEISCSTLALGPSSRSLKYVCSIFTKTLNLPPVCRNRTVSNNLLFHPARIASFDCLALIPYQREGQLDFTRWIFAWDAHELFGELVDSSLAPAFSRREIHAPD